MTNVAISRRSDVVSRVEGDETLVLDLRTQTAHCLSGDVATVWNAEGASLEKIAAATGLASDAVSEAADSLVELGLATVPAGLSRRTLIARGAAVGGAVVVAGAISIPLPAAANAASAGLSLTRPNACASNNATLVFSVTSGHLAPSSTYSFTFTYYTNTNHTADSGTVTITVTTDATAAINGASATGNATNISFTASTVTFTSSKNYFGLVSSSITLTRSVPALPLDSKTFTANAPGC